MEQRSYLESHSLKMYNKKALNYIKEEYKYPLPYEITTKGRLRYCVIISDFIDLSLNAIKAQRIVSTDMDKDVVVCFDEMKMKVDLFYDTVQDNILGPHSTVQVVVVRGVIKKWKHPTSECKMIRTII